MRSSWLIYLLALCGIFSTSRCYSQAPAYQLRELADINPTGSSFPLAFTGFQDELYFFATGSRGRELYKTDGISVTEVVDLNPTGDAVPEAGYAVGSTFVEFNSELYFWANDAAGVGLFKTDGSEVKRVSDIEPRSIGDSKQTAIFNGELYFAGRASVNSTELYKTDGVSTTLVGDINPAGSSNPGQFTLFGDQLFFSATGPQGREVYRTDGVQIEQLADINPTGGSNPNSYFKLGTELYFVAEGRENDRELYKTDGAAVVKAADFNPDYAVVSGIPQGGSDPSGFTQLNDAVFFSARDSNGENYELYSLDETGAELLADLNAQFGSRPQEFVSFSGSLFFSADGVNGRELFKTDGVNTMQVGEINPGGSANPAGFFEFAGELYFGANETDQSPTSKIELFKTDGNSVTKVSSPALTDSILPQSFVESEGYLYFLTAGPHQALYQTNGTVVTKIVDVVDDPDAYGPIFMPFNDKFYFVLNGEHGRELFIVSPVPEPATYLMASLAMSFFWRRFADSVR